MFMKLQKLVIVAAMALVALGAAADSLTIISVNSPGIYCRFSANCQPSATVQSDSVATTNDAATCVLMSRTFAGTTMSSSGQYGYEYQLTLNNNNNSDYKNNSYVPGGAFNQAITNLVTINTLTLDFDQPLPFAFGGRASNQVWVVNGLNMASPGPAPGSADSSGKQVTFNFDPPLVLNAQTTQTISTCPFGLVSVTPPQISTAFLSGFTQDPVNGTEPVMIKLRVQMP
jgi:hypothetical protein